LVLIHFNKNNSLHANYSPEICVTYADKQETHVYERERQPRYFDLRKLLEAGKLTGYIQQEKQVRKYADRNVKNSVLQPAQQTYNSASIKSEFVPKKWLVQIKFCI